MIQTSTMKKCIFYLSLFIGVYSCNENSETQHYCSYVKTENNNNLCDDILGNEFTSPREAEKAVNDILEALGIPKANFILVRCDNIENCIATIVNDKRYIIYDNIFIEKINNQSKTNWSSVSILAHEIGHHLNGHTLNNMNKDLNLRREEELDADYTSGFVLAKLGATLAEAQSAMLTLVDGSCDERYLSTHPCRKRRLQAIENGWKKAYSLNSQPPKSTDKKVYPILNPNVPGVSDKGYSNLPKFYVDIDNDGIKDYGRFVGNESEIFLSFQKGTKTGFSTDSYSYNSYKKIDKGILSRAIWLEDVNHDGRLDYCRYVGNFPGIYRAAILGTSTGFDGEHYYKF